MKKSILFGLGAGVLAIGAVVVALVHKEKTFEKELSEYLKDDSDCEEENDVSSEVQESDFVDENSDVNAKVPVKQSKVLGQVEESISDKPTVSKVLADFSKAADKPEHE